MFFVHAFRIWALVLIVSNHCKNLSLLRSNHLPILPLPIGKKMRTPLPYRNCIKLTDGELFVPCISTTIIQNSSQMYWLHGHNQKKRNAHCYLCMMYTNVTFSLIFTYLQSHWCTRIHGLRQGACRYVAIVTVSVSGSVPHIQWQTLALLPFIQEQPYWFSDEGKIRVNHQTQTKVTLSYLLSVWQTIAHITRLHATCILECVHANVYGQRFVLEAVLLYEQDVWNFTPLQDLT